MTIIEPVLTAIRTNTDKRVPINTLQSPNCKIIPPSKEHIQKKFQQLKKFKGISNLSFVVPTATHNFTYRITNTHD